MQAQSQSGRRSRVWLYGPYLLLAILAVAWSVGWFVIRGRVVGQLDSWLTREAERGRSWDCPGRQVAGFPFRIEITCDSLAFTRADLSARLGRLTVVAQVYDPSHVIALVQGPLRVEAGPTTVEAQWRDLRTSVHNVGDRPDRGDLVADEPVVTFASAGAPPTTMTSQRLEAHLRPNPIDAGAADVALQLTGARIPNLDALIGGSEPADLDLVAEVSRARDLPDRALVSALDGWRAAGGRLNVPRLTLSKGARRVQAAGVVGLDDLHRPEGRFDVASAGIEGLLGRYVGGRAGGVAGVLGALLGGGRPVESQRPTGGPGLTSLPQLRVAGGKLSLGPLQIPGVRVDPLY